MRRLTSLRSFLVAALFISAVVVNVSPAFAAVLPTAPTAITATPAPASIIVNWSAPAAVGDGVTGYRVDYAVSTDAATWITASSSIPSSSTSYTITSLNSTVKYFVRVAALNAGTPGPFGYPWTRIYSTSTGTRSGTSIVYDTGYGLGGSDTATVLANAQFTRVKYRLEFTNGGTLVYADADMAKWDTSTLNNASGTYTSSPATIANLRIPSTDAGNTFQIHTNAQDLTVVSSDSTLNTSGKVARLEIWPWNYGTGLSGLTPAGSGSIYDFDDIPSLAAAYGSFQVANATNAKNILAWNNHSGTPDIGIGDGSGNTDWTFAANFNSFANFHVYIYVNIPVTPNAPTNSTITLTQPSGVIYRANTTLTAATSTTGKVTFFANGKRIPGCVAVRTVTNVGVTPNTYSATCSWKPSIHGNVSLSAFFQPTVGISSSMTLSAPTLASKRTSNR